MRAAIKREYEAIGEYPGLPSPRSALRDRVIGKPSGEYLDFSDLLIENIYDGALELLSQKVLLYAQSEPIVPPNYAVFDVVGSPATIFSFNLDGLAKRFCGKRHVVLEPHGHIDRRWLEGERYTFLRNLVAYHDIPLHHLTPKLLPSPEPPGSRRRVTSSSREASSIGRQRC
jgi:hypothetical protein